jgi:hypothetical protein
MEMSCQFHVTVLQCPLDRKLDGPQCWLKEEKYHLPLPGIKPKFLDHLVLTSVTIPIKYSSSSFPMHNDSNFLSSDPKCAFPHYGKHIRGDLYCQQLLPSSTYSLQKDSSCVHPWFQWCVHNAPLMEWNVQA